MERTVASWSGNFTVHQDIWLQFGWRQSVVEYYIIWQLRSASVPDEWITLVKLQERGMGRTGWNTCFVSLKLNYTTIQHLNHLSYTVHVFFLQLCKFKLLLQKYDLQKNVFFQKGKFHSWLLIVIPNRAIHSFIPCHFPFLTVMVYSTCPECAHSLEAVYWCFCYM